MFGTTKSNYVVQLVDHTLGSTTESSTTVSPVIFGNAFGISHLTLVPSAPVVASTSSFLEVLVSGLGDPAANGFCGLTVTYDSNG